MTFEIINHKTKPFNDLDGEVSKDNNWFKALRAIAFYVVVALIGLYLGHIFEKPAPIPQRFADEPRQ